MLLLLLDCNILAHSPHTSIRLTTGGTASNFRSSEIAQLDRDKEAARVMTSRPPKDPIDELGSKIDALREGRKPKPATKGGKYAAAGFGWRMTVDLVTGVFVGAAMGWGLDSLFGTKPAFLIVFVLLGFAAGVKVMMKSAEDYQKDQARPEKVDGEG